MQYPLCTEIQNRPELRASFMELAERVFGLSFREWHRNGYWTGRYIPYALLDRNRVVANVSVNRMSVSWQGTVRPYLQIGTVMTDPDYRGQELSRLLMDVVLRDWAGRCDCIYLFANDSVLDFYPRFGFVRTAQYQYELPLLPRPGTIRTLNLSDRSDRALLRASYKRGNPYAALSVSDQFELLMFHCLSAYAGCCYQVDGCDVIAVAATEGDTLNCLDLFGGGRAPLRYVLEVLAAGLGCRRARLGFTPTDYGADDASLLDPDDDALFLLRGNETPFKDHRLLFPLLSKA